MPYQTLLLGANLSEFAEDIEVQHEQIRSFERAANASAPVIKPVGMIWDRTDYPVLGEAYLRWNGSAWTLLFDPDHAQVNAGGTVAFTADQPMGGFKLTGLAAGSAAGHSVRFEQVVLVTGANAWTGNHNAGGNRLTNLGAPTSDNDAARRVDANAIKFFQTTGTGAGRIDSGWTPGTTTFVQRINATAFTPETAQLVIRGRLLDGDDADLVDQEVRITARFVRWRHHSDNGGVVGHVAGWIAGVSATGGATTYQVLAGEFNNAQSSSYDWRSAVITGNGGRNWRLYVKFHTGGTTGFEFWLRRESNEYLDIDEVGGGGEGVVELLVEGGNA